jgi:hypothetical protein
MSLGVWTQSGGSGTGLTITEGALCRTTYTSYVHIWIERKPSQELPRVETVGWISVMCIALPHHELRLGKCKGVSQESEPGAGLISTRGLGMCEPV